MTAAGTVEAGAGLTERIASAYATLSPQEQRVADLIRDRADSVALYNSTELAQLSGVSKATVSRLFRRLGFSGSHEVRDLLRAERSSGIPVALGSVDAAQTGMGTELDAQLRLDQQNLARLYAGLDPALLSSVATAVEAADRVLVVGFRSAAPVALQLRQQLAHVREEVMLGPQPGQSIAEEIAGLGAGDVVILIGFRRRPDRFAQMVAAVVESGARALLITDPTGRRHGAALDWVIECPIESASPFDSYAAAMSLISVLAGSVLTAAGAVGRARVAAITSSYARLGELETS